MATPMYVYCYFSSSKTGQAQVTGDRQLYGVWQRLQKPLGGYYKATGVVRPNKTLPFRFRLTR